MLCLLSPAIFRGYGCVDDIGQAMRGFTVITSMLHAQHKPRESAYACVTPMLPDDLIGANARFHELAADIILLPIGERLAHAGGRSDFKNTNALLLDICLIYIDELRD